MIESAPGSPRSSSVSREPAVLTDEAAGPIGAPERAVALLALVFALGFGAVRMWAWTARQNVPGAESLLDVWPLSYIAVAALLAVAALVVRASLFEVALAAIGWTLCVDVSISLPTYASAGTAGDGPLQLPIYVAIALATGLYALRGVGDHTTPERACVLLALWSTAGVKMFRRMGETSFVLLAAAALLTFVYYGRSLDARRLTTGPARAMAWATVALIGWWVVATAMGEGVRYGVEHVSRLVMGALIAWALAGALGLDAERRARGVRLVFGAHVVALLLGLAMLAAVLSEMAQYNTWERIFGWRLRLFDLHANQIGPYFVIVACYLLPAVLAGKAGTRATGLPRWLLAILVAISLACLAWTRSRGAFVGLACGLVLLPFTWSDVWLRRLPKLAAAAGLAGLLALGVFATSAGDGLRAKLDQLAQSQSSIGQRWHFWKMSLAAIEEDPAFGIGPNLYWSHARYAEPSFYDGTNQTLHPHNIVLAAGEAAGVPGIVLFVAFCLLALELGRRRILDEREAAVRPIHAGFFVGTAALLGANMLDLGLSQPTFVPVALWVALGVWGTGVGRAGEPRPAPGRWGTLARVVPIVLAVPLVAMPLAGNTLTAAGRILATMDRREDALRCYRAVLDWVQPWSDTAGHQAVSAYKSLRERDAALAMMRYDVTHSPTRGYAHFKLATELLERGRPEQALRVLDRAQEYDPRGPLMADYEIKRAWAYLQMGDEEQARACLLEGLRTPGGRWMKLPIATLPPHPRDPPGARR